MASCSSCRRRSALTAAADSLPTSQSPTNERAPDYKIWLASSGMALLLLIAAGGGPDPALAAALDSSAAAGGVMEGGMMKDGARVPFTMSMAESKWVLENVPL